VAACAARENLCANFLPQRPQTNLGSLPHSWVRWRRKLALCLYDLEQNPHRNFAWPPTRQTPVRDGQEWRLGAAKRKNLCLVRNLLRFGESCHRVKPARCSWGASRASSCVWSGDSFASPGRGTGRSRRRELCRIRTSCGCSRTACACRT
jgi:hypothetical protein